MNAFSFDFRKKSEVNYDLSNSEMTSLVLLFLRIFKSQACSHFIQVSNPAARPHD